MANLFNVLVVICTIAYIVVSCSISTVESSGEMEMEMGWINSGSSTIADILGDDVEFEFDSEISRRILATTKYISYGALQRNTVPCSRRGASYYNCQSGASANPYKRGCSAITRCRG
ncbi:hypothetical protein ACFE04_028447 [Oxalis oulophora]